MSAQFVDGGSAAPSPPAGSPSRRPHPADERRARGDYGVPYQAALAAQDLLDAILGDEPFDLADAAALLATLARFTADGHSPDRAVWTRERVLIRVQELVELYNPPPELGGDVGCESDRWPVSAPA